MRDQLRRAALIIAAANDADLLRLRGNDDDTAQRLEAPDSPSGRVPAPRQPVEPPQRTGRRPRLARPRSGQA
ncbi:hypothetical protein I6A84_04325 [Frankia sp. CNm7]|uniref:Uncharacterized protein n=1 Tax=Frankia nepalensis TaxID=1836974 RepID=A0A937UWI5_9ACTN|nr:hypothetical protein [Frankia nepalensis]MBL7501998.1 hypothetical protein [Frankia nepalensis]MBL7510628.1 hypothetical protein [Frankia nepalensis]MBL7517368.1 hypothetical protein [Frankia nepalensis]MBL7633451.1 hypothetical protein [Frankia nepalensis]